MAKDTAAEERDSVEEPDDEEQKPKPRAPTVKENEDDNTVTVDLGDEEEPQSRKARRGGRQAEEVARLRREAEEARNEVTRLRQESAARFNQIEQRVQPQADPYKAKIASIRAEQETIQAAIRRGGLEPAQMEQFRTRFYQLNDDADDARDERILARADQRAAQRQPQGQGEEAIIRAEFPDVVGNARAVQWAVAEYNRMVADPDQPAPPTLATSRKAMEAAAVKFRLRQPAAPAVSASDQQRFGAVPGQAQPRSTGSEIRLDNQQKRMAIARWPELEEHDAYKKMASLLRASEREERETRE